MTIDEAIELQMKIAGKGSDCWKNCRNTKKHCKDCMAEHEQIAEWLEELKSYRASVFSVDMTQKMLKEEYNKAIDDLLGGMNQITYNEMGMENGYNKAIDDFAERIIRYVDCGHLCSPTEIRWSDLSVVEMVKEIAEQLKAGESDEE